MRIWSKIEIFGKKMRFWGLTQVEILAKKFRFWYKIEILITNCNFFKFDQKSKFVGSKYKWSPIFEYKKCLSFKNSKKYAF